MPSRRFESNLPAIILASLVAVCGAGAKTENGNDMCLYLSEAIEAGNRDEIDYLKDEAEGVNYFFRYLKILDMRSGRQNGQPYVDILSHEPSSYLKIKFRVTKKMSLTTLMQEPQSKIGSAIAVTGRTAEIDEKKGLLVLAPVIVRHKDRLTPKAGKELLGEVVPTARYYSYTAVKGKSVEVCYADRDLIDNNKDKMPAFDAPYAEKEAWASFLIREVAKRKRIREQQLLETKIRAGVMRENTNEPGEE